MKALVLAAGEGTRLRPLTLDRPKPMVPIGGRPLLEHTLRHLKRHGVRDVALNLHYKPESIVEYFGNGEPLGMKITYSWEDPILGTAGAVKKLEPFFDGTFLVVYGDVLTDLDLSKLVDYHRRMGAIATIALYRVPDPWARSVVALDQEGWISRFVEKPKPEEAFDNLSNSGIYVLEPEVQAFIPPDTFYDFGRDVFPRMLGEGKRVAGYPIDCYLIDVGSPENYARADDDVQSGRVLAESGQ